MQFQKKPTKNCSDLKSVSDEEKHSVATGKLDIGHQELQMIDFWKLFYKLSRLKLIYLRFPKWIEDS